MLIVDIINVCTTGLSSSERTRTVSRLPNYRQSFASLYIRPFSFLQPSFQRKSQFAFASALVTFLLVQSLATSRWNEPPLFGVSRRISTTLSEKRARSRTRELFRYSPASSRSSTPGSAIGGHLPSLPHRGIRRGCVRICDANGSNDNGRMRRRLDLSRETYRLSIGTSSSEIILSCNAKRWKRQRKRERKEGRYEGGGGEKSSSLFLPHAAHQRVIYFVIFYSAPSPEGKSEDETSSLQRSDFAYRGRKEKGKRQEEEYDSKYKREHRKGAHKDAPRAFTIQCTFVHTCRSYIVIHARGN